MKKIITLLSLASSTCILSSHLYAAEKLKINFNFNQLQALSKVKKSNTEFTQIKIEGFENYQKIGAPSVPVKSYLVVGRPENIQVQIKKNQQIQLSQVKPLPAQEQDCRCETAESKQNVFSYNENEYTSNRSDFNLEYVGSFRGQPLSRLDVLLAKYDQKTNSTTVSENVEVLISSETFKLQSIDYKDMLILGSSQLLEGAQEFVEWKKQQGFNVYTEVVTSPMNTTSSIQALVKKQYLDNGVDFVIILGDESAVPMFRVSTSGSNQTPSDLKYFTFDGNDDYIPDVLTSRIVAADAVQVKAQLAKSMEYEQRSWVNGSGWNRIVGIASNEGSGPSDNEYIQSIENKFKEKLNSEVVHLYQNDSKNSRPEFFNQNMNLGVSWITYMGHGSGDSWPSFNYIYSVSHVKDIKNKDVVKPIIIDVACQNGRLVKNYLGTSFMQVGTTASNYGAAAYYGGSVNISWHPPAVMARGIAFQHMEQNYQFLGEALLAGQLYLASQWSNKTQVVDNFEWYHLQGDPSMRIRY